jgi:hypothetical protein
MTPAKKLLLFILSAVACALLFIMSAVARALLFALSVVARALLLTLSATIAGTRAFILVCLQLCCKFFITLIVLFWSRSPFKVWMAFVASSQRW